MSEATTETTETPSATEDTSGATETNETNEGDNPLLKALHSERSTVKELKAQIAKMESESEKKRMESLSEAERAIEEARKAGYESALAEMKADVTRSKVTAAAAAAGFADPADASGFLNVAELDTDADVKAAIEALAKAKPYLIKRAQVTLEQGPQGTDPKQSPSDWLRKAMS